MASPTTITLTPAQYSCSVIPLTGFLSSDVFIVFPLLPGWQWVMDTTGVNFNTHAIHFTVAGGYLWSTVIAYPGCTRLVCGNNGHLYGSLMS